MTTPVISTPVSNSPLKPGYLTSEGWLSLLTVILGALPALLAQSKLLANASPIAIQIAGLIVSGLSTVHFTAQRSSLKKAHLTACAPRYQTSAAGALATAALTTLVIGLVCSCGGTSPALTGLGSAAGSAAESGLQCEGVDLEGLVGFGPQANLSVLEAVAADMLTLNFAGAVADLVKGLGGVTIGCAELALEDIENALKGQGSASPQFQAALVASGVDPDLVLQRIAQLKQQYGWKRAAHMAKRAGAIMHDAAPARVAEPVGEDGSTYRREHPRVVRPIIHPTGAAVGSDAP